MKLFCDLFGNFHQKFHNFESTRDKELKFCMSKHLEMCVETKFQPIWLKNDRDIERATWRAKEQFGLPVTVNSITSHPAEQT